MGADEPPPLPPNAELSQIGKRVPRIDAVAKVTGAARYTVDIKLPGMLFARLLRSPYPHARVLHIDDTRAREHEGVRALHLVNDIGPRENAAPTLSHVGAIVAAVAAVSRAEAEEALSLIKITYEPLPFVVNMNEARLPDAPLVAELEATAEPNGNSSRSNVRGPMQSPFGGDRGDVARGFEDADVIAEGVFETQVQAHSCLEPHAIIADWQPSGLTVYLSTQDVTGCRAEIASAFDLPAEKVRVVCDFMGGGFGSKLAPGDFALLAIALSRQAGAPVSLVLDRHEEQQDGGNRPSTWQKLRLEAKRSGELTAVSLVSYGTAGVARGAGVGNVAQAMSFRDRIDANAARREERRIGAERIGWRRRSNRGSASGYIKRSIGVAQSSWPGIVQASGSCEVIIGPDGSVEVRSSVQDIGTGTKTVLAQTVAEELGLSSTSVMPCAPRAMFKELLRIAAPISPRSSMTS